MASYLELRALAPHLPVIPVVQGWHLADYLACVELYRAAGVDLARVPLTGLGSVCRRQSTGQIAVIVTTLAALGLRLHGFGIKTTGLHLYGHLLASADSMAWSYAARRAPALPGCTGHRNCANCLTYATSWRDRILAADHVPRLPGQPVRPRTAGGGGMTAITAWRTDEPCPVCATGLILHDDGTTPAWAECRLCGWADTWTGDDPDGGDR